MQPWRVILGSDAKGIEPNATLIASLLRHSSQDIHVRIFSRELTPRSFVSGRLTLEVVRTPEDLCFTGKTQAHVSSSGAFDRMAALACCDDWDRAVVFDYDQLVIDDPSELFEMDLGEALAAVRIWPGTTLGHACREFVGQPLPEQWKECESYRFFHMGPVLNLAAMRRAGTLERFIHFHQDCHMEEQVALCAACRDRVIGFDEQLNWFPSWAEVSPGTKILHYYGSAKPWTHESLYGGSLWRSFQVTWNELTYGLWQTDLDGDQQAIDFLGGVIRAARRSNYSLKVLEIGGWNFTRMKSVARQWLRSADDQWSIALRSHVYSSALEEAMQRFASGLGALAERTEILDGESAEILGWMLTQDDRWESHDAVVLHPSSNRSSLMTEAFLSWKLVRPGGALLIESTEEGYGQLTRNNLWRTIVSFLESIRDESNSGLLLSDPPKPGATMLVCKNPSSLGSAEDASFRMLSAFQPSRHDDFKSSSKAIVLELQGRLGNQMFQYAHARALAKRLDAALFLTHEEGEAAFQLGDFGIACHPAALHADLVIDVPDECRKGQPWTWEDQIRNSPAKIIKLRGFFQNETCFGAVSDEIRQTFFVQPRELEDAGDLPVCVHVRRGDFANSPKHEVCHPDYYNQAISLISMMHPNARFRVISDDPQWCRKHLHPRQDLVVLDAQPSLEALATMMACKAFVISNSSFSWWGAWLTQSPLVICPTKGLADRNWEMFPERWIRYPGEGIGSGSCLDSDQTLAS